MKRFLIKMEHEKCKFNLLAQSGIYRVKQMSRYRDACFIKTFAHYRFIVGINALLINLRSEKLIFHCYVN